MAYVYKNAVDDKNLYAKDGWDIMPINLTGGNVIVFKDIKIPFTDPMVQELIKQYETPDWQKYAMGNKQFADYYEKIGYRFSEIHNADTGSKRYEMKLTDEAREHLSTWRVEMDFSDGYLRISPFDITFPYSFYNKKLLDRYAGEIVESAKGNNLIKCARISS